ncbi:MAG: substrate-binding domain-containing protein [Planctomycetaceae bacterium]|nr:substrate-binding domain-containing protein [Planctomycetaceae bacterium]
MITRFRTVALAACLVAVLVPPALAGERSGPLFGYSACNLVHDFQIRLRDAVAAEVVNQGAGIVVRDANDDPEEQLRGIWAMLAEGADTLIVVPTDNARIDAILLAARSAGVPLIFANQNPFTGERPPENVYYVGADPFAEGEAQMLFVGDEIGADGRVFILEGSGGNPASEGRTRGARSIASGVFREMALLMESGANWQRDHARMTTTAWLDAFGAEKMDAIVAANDSMALGAIDALEERGIDDVVVVGVDALPEALQAIRDGKMAGTVVQDAEEQGRLAVHVAGSAVAGGKQGQIHIVPSSIVTREELERDQGLAAE